jgi:hypothetical protein
MTTWVPGKRAGCIGVGIGLPLAWGSGGYPSKPAKDSGHAFGLWVIPPSGGFVVVYTVWRSAEGEALARGVIEGTTPPGVFADWCDENPPWVGTFTPYMGAVLRGWVEPNERGHMEDR